MQKYRSTKWPGKGAASGTKSFLIKPECMRLVGHIARSWKHSVVTALCCALALMLPAARASAAGWTQVFEDNFDGNSLNSDVWATRYIYANETLDHLNDEAQRYRDHDNQVIRDGHVELTARKTPQGWESGMIRTRQTFYYGYFETRVKLPSGRGIFPAFWINPDYDGDGKLSWPPEIDVFEYVVNGKDDTEYMLHSAGSYQKDVKVHFSDVDPHFNLKLNDFYSDKPLSAEWHVVGLLWLPHQYSVYLDGKRLFTRTFEWATASNMLAAPAHVILNFAVGGGWAGRYGIDESQFPQAMSVDYLRICQFSKVTVTSGGCKRGPFTPDLSGISYDAPGDMPKATFGNLRVEPQPATSAPNGSRVQRLTGTLSNIPEREGPLSMIVEMRNAGASKPVKILAVPIDAGAAEKELPIHIDIETPSELRPDDANVELALVPTSPNLATPAVAPLSVNCLKPDGTQVKRLACPVAATARLNN